MIVLENSNGTTFELPELVWNYLWMLAKTMGWREEIEDDEAFMCPDGKELCPSDSSSLADSIERLLEHPARHENVEIIAQAIDSGLVANGEAQYVPVPRIEFGEDDENNFKSVAEFLRCGSVFLSEK
jgi:hypothetical protein